MRLLDSAISLLFISSISLAQLPPPNSAGVAMGHLHLRVKDVDAHKKFWIEYMGAVHGKLGNMDAYKIPGVVVLILKGDPSAGTKGSVINHLGFKVPDVKAFVDRVKPAGANIVTAAEVPQAKGDYWFNPGVKTNQAFIMAPDEVKIEISEEPGMKQPIAHHHIHFYTASVDDTKKWYVTNLNAAPSRRGIFETADVPGVNLSFSKEDKPNAPTKGRSVDHIGFEIRDLEAYCKKMESMGVKFDIPYRKIPALNLGVAFFTDPWGTYVELTEGLDRL